MATELTTKNVDIKRDVRQTVLCLSPAQTKILFVLNELPRARVTETKFTVPLYPDKHTGPGKLVIIGVCDGPEVRPCPTCDHYPYKGFESTFVWVGNNFSYAMIGRRKFSSIKKALAEIERRVNVESEA